MKQNLHLKKTLWLALAGACLAPAMALAQFVYPVSGTVPTNGHYGACRDGCSRTHTGLDISGSTGTLVGAGYAGTASFVGVSCGLSCGYGRLIILDHASSYQTYYAHLDSFVISKGASVSQNQNIARRGSTGSSTGPHVHYEIRRYGSPLFIPGDQGQSITRNSPVPESYPGLSTPTTVTVDNHHSGFSTSANWATSTYGTQKLGPDYRWRSTTAVSDPATWTGNLPTSGSWRVDAHWTSGTNRSTTAPYIVHHSGGSSVVHRNQQVNGGKWVSLGTYSFGGGNRQVQLSCWTASGYVVIADGVRWVKQ